MGQDSPHARSRVRRTDVSSFAQSGGVMEATVVDAADLKPAWVRSDTSDGIEALRARVTVVIPALNEAENLPHVLPRIPAWVHEVLIVDGYSIDGTAEVAVALMPQARIIQQTGRG